MVRTALSLAPSVRKCRSHRWVRAGGPAPTVGSLSNICSIDWRAWAGTTRTSRGPSWSAALSGRPRDGSSLTGGPEADGGDSPAWSRKREPYEPRRARAGRPSAGCPTPSCTATPTSASSTAPATPRSWPRRPPGSGLEALALTDHDGFYGVVRFAEAAARARACRTVFGAELSLGLPAPQNGVRRPGGQPPAGAGPRPGGLRPAVPGDQRRAAGGREKGRPVYDLDELAGRARRATGLVLTGCRKGAVPQALADRRPGGRRAGSCAGWSSRFGRDNVAVELCDHGDPLDSARNDALAELAAGAGLRRGRHQQRRTTPPRRRAGWPPRWPRCGPGAASTRSTAGCPPAGAAHLRSGAEMARAVRPLPRRGRAGGRARPGRAPSTCTWSRPTCPPFPCPPGHDRDRPGCASSPREGAARRYGPPDAERRRGRTRRSTTSWTIIEQLGFPGYFLIVQDIVDFCRAQRHPLPGPGLGGQLGGLLRAGHHQRRRGGARPAVRAVPVPGARRPARHRPRHRVRPPRGGHPVRLRAATAGDRAAQVANVITYRPRSAVRDMAKALGLRARASRTPGPSRSTRWARAGRRPPSTDEHPGRRCVELADQMLGTSPATSASTPAAW